MTGLLKIEISNVYQLIKLSYSLGNSILNFTNFLSSRALLSYKQLSYRKCNGRCTKFVGGKPHSSVHQYETETYTHISDSLLKNVNDAPLHTFEVSYTSSKCTTCLWKTFFIMLTSLSSNLTPALPAYKKYHINLTYNNHDNSVYWDG